MPATPTGMRSIDVITLDLDDTLWPVRPVLISAEQVLGAWLAEHAPATAALLDPTRRARIRAQLASQHPDRTHDMSFMRREALRAALVQAGESPALAEAAFEVFLDARQRVQPYPDVHAVLARWAARYRLVALSNGNADIRRTGLGHYFAAAISAHEAGHAKPDRRIFEAACASVGAAASNCLHVGDDWSLDVQAARAAGLHAAWLRRPEFAHRSSADPAAAEEPVFTDLESLDRHLHAR